MTAPTTLTILCCLATAAGNALEDHSISLGTVAAVGGIVLPAAWWLSRKFTQIDDRAEGVAKQLKSTELQFTKRLIDIERKIDDLPCVHARECPVRPENKS